MDKKYFVLAGIIILIFIIIIFYLKNKSFVVIDNEKIFVEIADTNSERQTGLMHRKKLCDDCGMLFVFEEEDIHSFWMKDTYISLDMIFINSDLEVVELLHAVPCEEEICESYIPKGKALYVLEVNSERFDGGVVGGRVGMKFGKT